MARNAPAAGFSYPPSGPPRAEFRLSPAGSHPRQPPLTLKADTTARWRIADPLLFLKSARDEAGAQSHLNNIIDSVVRDTASSAEPVEIVRSKDWNIDPGQLAPAAAPDTEQQPVAQIMSQAKRRAESQVSA